MSAVPISTVPSRKHYANGLSGAPQCGQVWARRDTAWLQSGQGVSLPDRRNRFLLPTITEVITIAVTKAITKETSAVSSGPGGENPTKIPELIISLASHHYQPARTVRVPRSHNAYCNPAHGSLFAANDAILNFGVTNPFLRQAVRRLRSHQSVAHPSGDQ